MENRYEQYKDSGIAWIGEIPEHWELKRFKMSGSFVKGKLPTSTNDRNNGLPIIGASEMLGKSPRVYTIDYKNIPLCTSSDILILWDGANAGITASNLIGVVSSTVVKYSCNLSSINNTFLVYVLKYYENFYKSKANGTTIPHMNISFINETPLIYPPIQEQQSIATYLDKKCSEIDELITLQEEMITKLQSYKQSVITEAVTKGLDKNVPLKDSGIEWIGEIPEHWNINKLFRVCELKARVGWKGLQSSEFEEKSYAYLVTGQDFRGPHINWSVCYQINKERYDEDPYIQLKNDDLLITKDGTIGKVAIVSNLDKPACLNSGIFVMRKRNNEFITKYMYWLFVSSLLSSYNNNINSGASTIMHLYQNIFYQMPLPIPSLPEQQSIADYLDQKCSEIDALISIKQQKIEKLKDYKKSLIFECVTGKRKVS